MVDQQRYEGFLRTGSGSQRVSLELDGATARIAVDVRWMGQDDVPARRELRFTHQPGSEWYGRLELTTLAIAAESGDALQPAPELNPDEALLPLFIEYVRVPPTPVFVHPESALAEMQPLGYARWNEHFQLILLVDDAEGWPEGVLWEDLRGRLDKAKLALVDTEPGG